MCIAVGKVSLDDWLRFTSSLGWIGFMEPTTPPASWMARFAITSLAFMFDCVPDPVWNTTSGNSASSLPSITSWAARTMRSTFSFGSLPSSPLASAQAFFSTPSARITERPHLKRSTPIGKFWIERCVCAPQRCSAGTGTSPSESCSMRVPSVGRVSVMSSSRRRSLAEFPGDVRSHGRTSSTSQHAPIV